MKILFLTRLYDPHIGGVEKHIHKLSQILSLNNQITILTEQFDSQLPLIENQNHISIYRIPTALCSIKSKKWTIWKYIITHHHWINSFDAVHVHDVVYWIYPLKLLHPTKKFFATFHGWEGHYPIPQKNIFQRRLDASLVTTHLSMGSYISRWYGYGPKYISFGASDQKPFSPAKLPVLLFMGRLDQDTGFRSCLEIYQKYKSTYHWRLEICGDGPLKSLVPAEAVFHGWVNNPSVYIKNARWIFTTGYLGIIEVLSANRAVIVAADNPLKKDYLESMPIGEQLQWHPPYSAIPAPQAVTWARQQTWSKLAKLYLEIWKKSQ